jgi:hypothetical protein
MNSPFVGLVVIIPTRNRAGMAYNSLRSALAIPANLHVLVSDNSTSSEERRRLAALCDRLDDDRVVCVTPPTPLPQGHHWDWAINQALATFPFDHFTVLTDRMLVRPALWPAILSTLRRSPDRIISYAWDAVNDQTRPIWLTQHHWSGRILEATSASLLTLASQGDFNLWLPRISNCIVPRHVFDSVQAKFSNICESRAPDANFCFKCLTVVDTISIYDASPVFEYAKSRSVGHSNARGVLSPERADFLGQVQRLGLQLITSAPDIQTVENVVFHEYMVVRRSDCQGTMPEIVSEAYVRSLVRGVLAMENQERRRAMQELLVQRYGAGVLSAADPGSNATDLSFSERVLRKIEWTLGAPAAKPLWTALAKAFGTPVPRDHRFEFATVPEAIRFAARHQVVRSRSRKHIARAFRGIELRDRCGAHA